MSHRRKEFQPGEKPQQKEAMNMLAGINHIMMCRSCQYNSICKSRVLCQIESTFSLKFEMLSEKMGDEFKKLTVEQLTVELDKITNDELKEFLDKKIKFHTDRVDAELKKVENREPTPAPAPEEAVVNVEP